MKIIGLVGTNSKKSTNRQLLQYMEIAFSGQVDFEVVEIANLPLFDKPKEKVVPAEVLAIAEKIEQADGVIISTPEYDHAVPAALMNALAWLSYGVRPLLNKPIMITGASYGTLGSSRAQSHLHRILHSPEINARVMAGQEFHLSHSLQAFDSNGELIDPEIRTKLAALFNDFCLFIKINEKLTHAQELMHAEVENFDWENL